MLLSNEPPSGSAEPLLPLPRALNVVVVGAAAQDAPIVSGDGSGHVNPGDNVITGLQVSRLIASLSLKSRFFFFSLSQTSIPAMQQDFGGDLSSTSTVHEQGIREVVEAAGGDVTYINSSSLDGDAAAVIAAADVAVVFVGTTCGEGADRPTLALGGGEQLLFLLEILWHGSSSKRDVLQQVRTNLWSRSRPCSPRPQSLLPRPAPCSCLGSIR